MIQGLRNRIRLVDLAALLLLVGPGIGGERSWAGDWTVRFGTGHAPLRALHGVNGGPLCYRGTVDLTAEHRALGIPFTRLHDAPWVNAEAVDVHYIFRNPSADPSDPANYDFRATDDYLEAVVRSGAQIVYRLGESIEHTARQYWVHPPRDPEAWAAVCAGIVKHYNEGWASGFRHGIRYWEIWNEPDVRPQMWTGTDEDYFRLYEVTAKTLKTRFPEIRVGGPAVGNIGDLVGNDLKPTPFVSAFLAYCRDRSVPLDFFSWHRYTADPGDIERRSRAVRRCLDDFGFVRTESHLNEWNYLVNDDWTPLTPKGRGTERRRFFETLGGPEGAAFSISVLLRLQDAPLDMANYYTAEVQGFGLFDFHGAPKTTAAAFRLFREFLDTPQRGQETRVVESEVAHSGNTAAPSVCVIGAGRNAAGSRAAILVSASQGLPSRVRVKLEDLPWPGSSRWKSKVVEGEGARVREDSGTLRPEGILRLPALKGPGVILMRLQPIESGDADGAP
ncbi:MAG: hypothetical protein JNK85_03660 [Verrucomicrobiales bacterium]|nr:hypothetical protein [Verrucomicrobiales bacterium]